MERIAGSQEPTPCLSVLDSTRCWHGAWGHGVYDGLDLQDLRSVTVLLDVDAGERATAGAGKERGKVVACTAQQGLQVACTLTAATAGWPTTFSVGSFRICSRLLGYKRFRGNARAGWATALGGGGLAQQQGSCRPPLSGSEWWP